jgi:CheY-like chemotaxis protein
VTDTPPSIVVLVVEDDDDVREIATAFLGDLGFSVRAARNGHEGLALIEQDAAIDVLVTDVAMPGDIDGIALARRALDLRPDLKIVITSGYAGHVRERQAEELPEGVPFLRKPYRLAALETIIRSLLFD